MAFINQMVKGILASFLVSSVAQAGIQIQQWYTPQGSKVLFVENHDLPMLDLGVSFKAGSGFDSPKQTGVANMTSSLLLKGSGQYSEADIAQHFADVGSQINTSIDDDQSNVTLRTLSSEKELNQSLNLLTTVFKSPQFSPNILEREKKRLLTSIQELDTRPAHVANRAFFTMAYGTHPYAHFSYGHRKDIEKLNSTLVKDFYKNFYNAKNAVIVLMGNISRTKAEKISIQISESLPKNETSQVVLKTIPDVDKPQKSKEQWIEFPSQQSHILIGLPALKRNDPDLFALTVGNYILGGGGFASRLMDEVREKRGYTYGISSYFYPNLQTGVFKISTQVKRESTFQALELIRKILEDYVKQGPTDKELNEAKSSLIGGYALRTDSNKKLLSYLTLIGMYDLPLDYLDTYTEKISQVTKQDVIQAFQRKLYPNGINQESPLLTVVVGQTKNK